MLGTVAASTSERAERERAELEQFVAGRGEGGRRGERIAGVRPHPCRREHAHGLGLETAEGVAHCPRRRRVQPLGVVDRQHDRAGVRETAKRRQHRASPRHRVVVAEERRIGVDLLEQIGEPHVSEGHLLLGGARDQDPVAGGAASSDRVAPQRRLADPRLATDQERAGAPRKSLDERVDARALGVASDDVRRAARQTVVHPSIIGASRAMLPARQTLRGQTPAGSVPTRPEREPRPSRPRPRRAPRPPGGGAAAGGGAPPSPRPVPPRRSRRARGRPSRQRRRDEARGG